MPHARQLIRDALVQSLIDAATAAGANVFPARNLPVRRSELPSISVYVDSEKIDSATWESAPVIYMREPDVVVRAWVESETGTDDVDAQLDDLAVEIEAAILGTDDVAGVDFDRIRLDSTEKLVTPDGDRLTGLLVVQFVARYHQEAIAAPTTLDEFLEANVSHDLGADTPEVDSVLVQE